MNFVLIFHVICLLFMLLFHLVSIYFYLWRTGLAAAKLLSDGILHFLFEKWHTHTAAFELFASMNDTFMSPAGQTGRWRRYVLDLSICSSILSSATRLVCDAYNFSTVSC